MKDVHSTLNVSGASVSVIKVCSITEENVSVTSPDILAGAGAKVLMNVTRVSLVRAGI